MDHDSVPLDLPGPKSHRIADVREAYEALARRGLHLMDEEIRQSDAYASNGDGHFAWDVSLLVRAAVLTWRVTGDVTHLRQAARWAQHMVERTDEALGKKDWRKRTSPAWSAGPRYTAGSATVGTYGGAAIELQAASSRVVLERPSENTAIVHSIRADGTSWSSPEASLLPSEQDYLPDVLARRSSIHAVLLRGLSAPIDLRFLAAGEYSVTPQNGTHLVHTGLIARSLIAAAEELELAGNRADDSEIKVDELYLAARRALLFHDEEVRIFSGQPWYVTSMDFPGRRLGLELPHNHIVDVASSFLILGRRDGDARLRGFGASLAQPMLDELCRHISGDLPHPWYYYPVDSVAFEGVDRDEPLAERKVSAVSRGEDSSHATMRARALLDWHAEAPELISPEVLMRISASFRHNFMTSRRRVSTLRWLPVDSDDVPNDMRLGYANAYAGAWGAFSRWDPAMKRRINSLAYQHPPAQAFGATVLSSAEILSMNSVVSKERGAPNRVSP